MRRFAVVTTAFWVASVGVAVAQPVHHDEPSWAHPSIPFSRVRSDQEVTTRLLADGYERSETLEHIERSDLLVYVFRWFPLSTVGGHLTVKGQANGHRTIFILISPSLSDLHSIVTIAHELQHAVEVAEAPEVVDRRSLRRFYQRTGDPAGPIWRIYDTAAARDVGAAVLSELRADRSKPEILPDPEREPVHVEDEYVGP